jgi:hypothetical protein
MASYQFEPMDLNRLSQALSAMPEFQQQAPIQRETNRLQQLAQPQMPEFQGLGKYANPYDFAAKDPGGFAKVNPQYAQKMQNAGAQSYAAGQSQRGIDELSNYLRLMDKNQSLSPEQTKYLYDYEQKRAGTREGSAATLMNQAGGNFDLAQREMLPFMAQQAAQNGASNAAQAQEMKRIQLMQAQSDLAKSGRQAAAPMTDMGKLNADLRSGLISPEQHQQVLTKSQQATVPAGYRLNQGGDLEPIPGGPADMKMQDRNRQKQSAIDSASAGLAVIDKALNHPGRETATGLSGTLDPRNYIPGTDATDFKVVMDQITGGAFLQAFESLKGAGQITEVEGKKATDAIARLNRSQSDKEFKASLEELQGIMRRGYERVGGQATSGNLQPRSANATPSGYDADKEARYQAWKKAQGR